MASPLGHALAGYAVGRAGGAPGAADLRLCAVCAVLAVAPDLDFAPGILLGRPALYHQGLSHSLAFAALAGTVAALALGDERLGFRRLWAVCAAAYGSHLLIDWLGRDLRPPAGIPLLWPFSDQAFLSPVALLPGIDHAATSDVSNGEWLAAIFSLGNARALALELGLGAALIALATLWAGRARQPAGTA
jgi:membrane-bound metal-dependent hydrolase YbcI (DUF457 family)